MKAPPHDIPDAFNSPTDARVEALLTEIQALRTELRRIETSAVENARMFAQARTRLLELSALNKVSRAIISTLDLPELLRLALRETVQITDADTGSIMLLDAGANTLRIAASHGLPSGVVDETEETIGEGLAGWVAEHRQPLLVANVADDPRFRLVARRDEIRSSMSVPLLTPKDMLGVICVARTSSTRPFTPQDLQLLGTVAGQISMAVENARLFEAMNRRYEELSVLTNLAGQLSSTLNLREVMEIIVDQSCVILRADAGAVFLLDDRRDILRARTTRNVGSKFYRRVRGRLGHGIIGEVALTGTPVYIEDVAGATDLECADVQAEEGLRSMLCAPLRVGGRSLGAVAIYTNAVHHWGDHDLNLFMAVAGQGAVALHNARNYQDQRGIAELVQKNLMPRMELGRDDLQVGHRYLPAKKVGGDYYDVFHLRNGKPAILMADVAGKSVQAAVHTAKGKYFIRALGYDAPSPAEVLRRANALIYADTAVETFISAFYGVLEPDLRLLCYCNAGHPPPLVVHADGGIEELGQPDILLGVLPDPEFTDQTIALQPGDTMVLTTDGVTEARADSVLYGQEGLRRCIAAHPCLTPQALANAIVDDVLLYSDSNVRDDVAVLVIRVP
jgi:GAF domain-containing protein